MYHRFSITTLAGAFIFWLIQKALDLIPILEPFEVGAAPDTWWYQYNTWSEWYYNREDGRPNSWLCSRAIETLWLVLGDWIEEVAPYVEDLLTNWVNSLVGSIPPPFSQIGSWLAWARDRISTNALIWWSNIVEAIHWLRNALPYRVREGLNTWREVFDELVQEAKDWVYGTYNYIISLGQEAYNWVVGLGASIFDWWQGIHQWLTWFRDEHTALIMGWLGAAWDWVVNFFAAPFAYITGLLDPWWSQLVNFCGDPIAFWFNLWSWYNDTIGPFFADPLGWLYDRVEQELVDRW